KLAFLRAPLWPAGHLPLKGGDSLGYGLSPISSAAPPHPAASRPPSPRGGEEESAGASDLLSPRGEVGLPRIALRNS
ncbi:MAG: hypothetical protein E5Y30_44735, partial [Mesorhizobium sp.]